MAPVNRVLLACCAVVGLMYAMRPTAIDRPLPTPRVEAVSSGEGSLVVDLVDGTSASERDALGRQLGLSLTWVHPLAADEALAIASVEDLAAEVGKADIIMEATGSSAIAFNSMKVLGHNGVLVWHSVTGGDTHTQVPSDQINIEFVLGNKLLLGSVNANREHFESGIKDLALGEVMYPGVIEKILTNPVDGIENYAEVMRLLVEDSDALKVYMNIAEE